MSNFLFGLLFNILYTFVEIIVLFQSSSRFETGLLVDVLIHLSLAICTILFPSIIVYRIIKKKYPKKLIILFIISLLLFLLLPQLYRFIKPPVMDIW